MLEGAEHPALRDENGSWRLSAAHRIRQ